MCTQATSEWAQSQYAIETQKAHDSGMTYVEGFYATNIEEGLSFSHNMEWVTAKAIDFIGENSTEPFFLYMNPTIPHSPTAKDALEQFTIRDTPVGTLSADPVSNMPSRTDIITRALLSPENRDKGYGATWLDDSVGAVYEALETNGVLDSTVVVFLMDHGSAKS